MQNDCWQIMQINRPILIEVVQMRLQYLTHLANILNSAIRIKLKESNLGGESMRFKKLYRKLKKLVSRDKTKDNYFFQKATFTELDAAGVLPLQVIGDYSNNPVDTKL